MSNLPCEKKPSFRYPIGFWNYPSVQVTPVSQVESWKRAGITCNQTPFFSYGSHDPADMVAMLDEMHRAGMRAFVCVSDLDFHRFLQDPEAFRPVFARAYADFGRHPATYGFFIGDEPLNGQEFSACVRAYQIMREIAPELTPLLNFNPYWEGMENDLLGGEAFDAWIDRFVRESGCPLICYDCYSQMNPGDEGINMYFRNLNRYVGAAERNEHAALLWAFPLPCPGRGRHPLAAVHNGGERVRRHPLVPLVRAESDQQLSGCADRRAGRGIRHLRRHTARPAAVPPPLRHADEPPPP